MNCTYRIVWSQVSNTWIAVAENARGRGKSTTGPRLVAAALALAGVSWGMPSAYAASAADAAVSAGSGHISTVGNTTTINQASQRLAIDWTSLSTRANEALVFSQPNAQAIALNRIIGSSPSELLGSLTANGQVFILNPNGVLFGAGSQVNVGGLVASTLSMSNADFMAGNHVFSNNGAAGSVVNQGTLNAVSGGYLALLAPEVRNEGVMSASLGTALLAAGDKVTLNLDNGSLIGYSIDQGAINALVENKQLIRADGGQVLMSAKALDQLSTAVVNNTGVIEARTVQNKNGRIMLMGDMDVGTVTVGGTLDASAPNGGDGGFIETSAAHVNVADTARITTRAEAGKTGQWLIDPFDFVVASAGGNMTGAALGSQLENNNVTLTTTAGNTGTDGDLSINDAVAWSAANTLTLIGERDVNVNANLTYSGSGTTGVTVQAVRDINVGADVAITSTGTGALPVVFGGPVVGEAAGGNINMGSGSSIATSGGDVSFKANAIKLAGASVATAGGNIAMAAAGTSASHSLEITNDGATRSNVATTGAGTISLSGHLTGGGASATGGSAGGLVVTNSSITSDTGAISITGTVSGASTGSLLERGFRLDSGALVTSAGNISLTGVVSGTQALNPPMGILSSAAGELAGGGIVSSTGGNVMLSGTFNNGWHYYDPTGLVVGGKVQSGAAGKVTLSALATVGVVQGGGNFSGGGTGLFTGASSEIVAGTGGLDITGEVRSSSTSTNLSGVSLAGTASSTGNIVVTGISSAPSASGVRALALQGTLTGLGTATITLKGSGVPAPAPASSSDIIVQGTTVSTAGGQINLIGDRIKIESAINSGSGRTVITPVTTGREITLNALNTGGGNEMWGLNLSHSELNLITASVLQLGGGAYRGDISIGNGFTTTTMTSTPALSLVTTGRITQTAGLTVNSLKAVGSSVTLTNTNNQISNISGIATSGSFQAASASGLTVGTVDGVSGINSAGKVLVRTTGASADLTLDSAVTAASTANDALVLVAGRNFINNVGAAALQIPGTARWQVWSANPANDSRNNLDYDFKQYNASYGTTTVAQSTGNGVFYTLAPTITSALTGTVSKTYDTATAATLTTANFSAAAGAVDGDTVILNTSTTGTYDNKNAGTGKTVTATGVSIASTTNGAKNVYGYTLGSASGNVGTITQASLAVSGIGAADKVYDASTSAALTGTAAISALGSDVVTVGGTGVGAFADKNVGTAKAVAVSGYTLSGADAGNYALIQPAGLTANITPKALGYSTTASDKTYDGNTTAVATLSGLTGLIGSETVTVSNTGATFNSKDVASANLVTVNSVTLADGANGGLASNYSIASGGTATAGITAKALGYSTTAANKIYDGTTSATLGGVLNGVVSGDTVALSQSGTFSDKNAATGKTVSYTSSLSGSDAGNYVLTSSSGTTTADITPALLTVAANSAHKFYDGVAYVGNNGVAISGLVNGETVADLSGSLGYGGSSQGAIGIGDYAITPGGLSSTNYQMDFVDGALTIKPLSQTSAALGGSALEPAYDSARQTVAVNRSGLDTKVPETSTLGAAGNSSGNGRIEDITPRLNLAGCGMAMPAPSDCQ